jgi:hypothetical protein
MTEHHDSPILHEPVKPPLLNPPVKPIAPSADLTWVLLCVSMSLGIFALAFALG